MLSTVLRKADVHILDGTKYHRRFVGKVLGVEGDDIRGGLGSVTERPYVRTGRLEPAQLMTGCVSSSSLIRYRHQPHPDTQGFCKVKRSAPEPGGGGILVQRRVVHTPLLARVQNENIPSIKNPSFQSLLKARCHWPLLSSNWPPPGSESGPSLPG